VKNALNWNYKPFEIPNKILNEWKKIGKKGQKLENDWKKIYKKKRY
jgi:transketolase